MSSAWPDAPRPDPAGTHQRLALIEAARAGELTLAVAGLDADDPRVRATAAVALDRAGALEAAAVAALAVDESHLVRQALAGIGASSSAIPLDQLLADPSDAVVETACWAAGEHDTKGERFVTALVAIATSHDDALCREAAVAALGAIGSEAGLDAILAGTRDKATVRRRAVLALAPFEGEEVAAALEQAKQDRDWQVRQAAEDLQGS